MPTSSPSSATAPPPSPERQTTGAVHGYRTPNSLKTGGKPAFPAKIPGKLVPPFAMGAGKSPMGAPPLPKVLPPSMKWHALFPIIRHSFEFIPAIPPSVRGMFAALHRMSPTGYAPCPSLRLRRKKEPSAHSTAPTVTPAILTPNGGYFVTSAFEAVSTSLSPSFLHVAVTVAALGPLQISSWNLSDTSFFAR